MCQHLNTNITVCVTILGNFYFSYKETVEKIEKRVELRFSTKLE